MDANLVKIFKNMGEDGVMAIVWPIIVDKRGSRGLI